MIWSSSFQTGLNMTLMLSGTLLLGRAIVQSTLIYHSLKRCNLCHSEITPCEAQLCIVPSAICVLSVNATFLRKVLFQTRQNCYIHLQDVKISFQSGNNKLNWNAWFVFKVQKWKKVTDAKQFGHPSTSKMDKSVAQIKELFMRLDTVRCLVSHVTNNFSMSGCSDYLLRSTYTLVHLTIVTL
jgi:hypothetical protein